MKITLGEVGTYINGYAFKPSDWGTRGLPIIRIQNLTNQNTVPNYFDGPYNPKFEVNKGDILIAWSGSLGIHIWQKNRALLNQHIFRVEFNKCDIDKMYFYYAVKHNIHKMLHLTHGATMRHIIKSDFEQIVIPYPSLDVQAKISKILNYLEQNIINYRNILLKLELLIKSRFVELISKNKLIYQKVRLKDCCLISSGATPSRKNSDYWDENGINWFKTTELKNNFLIDSEEKISKLGYEKTSVKLLPKHTVLIAMYGQGKTRGMTGYLLNNATTNQACAALISLDIINPKYLWYTMINSYDRLRNMAKGGTQPNLSVSSIKNFEITLPPIGIQNKFTNYIEQINKLKSDVQKSIDETQLLMDSLMQEYFG